MVAASVAIVQRYHLHPDGADWYHLENLAFHAAEVALGLWLFRLLLRRRTAALIAGSLFAMHPAQVPITSFIGGRSATLSLLFVLMFAIGLKLGSTMLRIGSRLGSARLRVRAYFWISISLAALFASIFTKEQVIGLILLTPLIAAAPSGAGERGKRRESRVVPGLQQSWRHWRQELQVRAAGWLWLGIYAIPVVVYVIACRLVLKGVHLPRTDWSFWLHFELVGRTIWYSVRILLVPTLTVLHMSTLGSWESSQPIVVVLGYGSAAAWVWLMSRVWRNLVHRMMTLWVTLTLLPCLNLVPIPSQLAAPFRMAPPLFGLAGLVGSVLVEQGVFNSSSPSVHRGRVAVFALLWITLGWYMLTSVQDVPNYRDNMAFMKSEVEADNNNIVARDTLAGLLHDAADHETPGNQNSLYQYTVCIDQLFGAGTPPGKYADIFATPEIARRLSSASFTTISPIEFIPALFYKRGNVLWSLGRCEDAIRDYSVAYKLAKRGDASVVGIGNSYRIAGDSFMKLHDFRKAEESYRAGLALIPEDPAMLAALMRARTLLSKPDKAVPPR